MDSQIGEPDLPANQVGARRANRKSTTSSSTKPPPFISCTRWYVPVPTFDLPPIELADTVSSQSTKKSQMHGREAGV
jgi:hypothetical protein